MSTTSLKLPDALKERIQHFAAESNTSAHALMVSALEREVARLQARAEFLAEADAAAADIDAGGPVYALDDVRKYILAKTAGKKPRRPAPVKRPAKSH